MSERLNSYKKTISLTINGSAKLWIYVDESNLVEDIGKEGVEAMDRVTKMIRQMTWVMRDSDNDFTQIFKIHLLYIENDETTIN